MIKFAVFASGRGSNFSALVQSARRGTLKARIALLVCDNPDALVIRRAAAAGVPAVIVRREDFAGRAAFEDALISTLERHAVDAIVLAGFMRLLSPRFVARYKNRIINIHPALLPAFKGAHAIKDAFDYGVKVTGVTVHFVDEKTDHGPIILQESVAVAARDTLATLEKKIHKLEHRLYPRALGLFAGGRLKVRGRRVIIGLRA